MHKRTTLKVLADNLLSRLITLEANTHHLAGVVGTTANWLLAEPKGPTAERSPDHSLEPPERKEAQRQDAAADARSDRELDSTSRDAMVS